MGDAARKFTNVFVKNFGEDIDEDKMEVVDDVSFDVIHDC